MNNNEESIKTTVEWVWRKGNNAFGEWECICSNCGKEALFSDDGRVYMSHYCPHCGKKIKPRTL